ncbi:WD repeat-containing protein 26-like [Watersipora subatra]|uniref:WD repeat-containing protein 26-like n=1 Tax=Watersipora subatra TaxID=2589382 RepID=UPI00355C8A96
MHQANGSVSVHKNGGESSSHFNGDCTASKVISAKKSNLQFSRKDQDIVRLVGQYLRSIGLEQTAKILIEESGLPLEHPVAARFRIHVLAGRWRKVDDDLNDLRKLFANEEHTITEMKFLILQQKYLELLEDGKVLEAVQCLRHEITPLSYNRHRVHQLSSLMMCESGEELRDAAQWKGKGSNSRKELLDRLQGFLPVQVMLPPRRMEMLLEQAVAHQVQLCKYHNRALNSSPDNVSLLLDHSCSKESFPSITTHILNHHDDQVWFCRFSPDGSMLATGCKDGSIIVWEIKQTTNEFNVKYQLKGHDYGVAHLAWSPDSKVLVACGPEDCADVWVWNCETGELRVRMTHSNDDSLTSAAFHHDSKRFVTGGTRGQFYQCDLDGSVIDSWEGVRVYCISCLNDGKTVLASDSHFRLRSYNFEDLTDQHILQENHAIMSFTVSDDGRLALINVESEGIHVWDLKDKCLVRKLHGVKQGFFTIHSCFGGLNQDFVASGSEDNIIYVWHIRGEKPICQLEGHTQTVNCVHWNPANPSMIASVSDDGTVRIWGPATSPLSTSHNVSTSRLLSGDSISALSGRCTPV